MDWFHVANIDDWSVEIDQSNGNVTFRHTSNGEVLSLSMDEFEGIAKKLRSRSVRSVSNG